MAVVRLSRAVRVSRSRNAEAGRLESSLKFRGGGVSELKGGRIHQKRWQAAYFAIICTSPVDNHEITSLYNVGRKFI